MAELKAILITYRDFSGNITERKISELRSDGAMAFDAFCHLRNARQTFKLERIVHAVDHETGELLNPYRIFSDPSSPETLDSLFWQAMPAIKALKFFTLTTRGFGKRERERVVQFLKEIANVSMRPTNEIEEWVVKLWCGDLYAYREGQTQEYTDTLKAIPSNLLDRCRGYALLISSGSGRKPVDACWLERIDSEFCRNPIVKPSLPS